MSYRDVEKLYDRIPMKLKNKYNICGVTECSNSEGEHYYEVVRKYNNKKMTEINIVNYFNSILIEREEKLKRILK